MILQKDEQDRGGSGNAGTMFDTGQVLQSCVPGASKAETCVLGSEIAASRDTDTAQLSWPPGLLRLLAAD